jgi:hypothetical protein
MATVAAKSPPKRRGGRRVLIAFVLLVLAVGSALVWLNRAAEASVNATGTLTVYLPSATVNSQQDAKTGAVVKAGDVVETNDKGRAGITLPDGTLTRLASNTTIKLDAAHFTKKGNLHDVSFTQEVGRTFTNVQHLVSGSNFDVAGPHATASVRGTMFEVYITPATVMTVKVFVGTVVVHNKNGSVEVRAGQQATVSANGVISDPIPIVPDPNDPFGPAVLASNQVAIGTTPGTEQDFIGAPLHNGEQQTYTYSYAGGSLVKGALGYPGSAMKLTIKAPDGQLYYGTGAPPITVTVSNAPGGIYTFIVEGVSGLGTAGEEPFLAVASVESCTTADNQQGGAVHRGYTAQDLVSAVQQSGQAAGLANLKLTISASSESGAIITGSGSYNGVGWSGSVVLIARNGTFEITPVSGNMFGLSVPAQQVVQQIAQIIGQDPSSISPGFTVDRLFTCDSVLIVDGRVG